MPDAHHHAIDIEKPVFFYDDRSKSTARLKVAEILFVKGAMVLCETRFPEDEALRTVLFDRDSREVLTDNFQFWYADNA